MILDNENEILNKCDLMSSNPIINLYKIFSSTEYLNIHKYIKNIENLLEELYEELIEDYLKYKHHVYFEYSTDTYKSFIKLYNPYGYDIIIEIIYYTKFNDHMIFVYDSQKIQTENIQKYFNKISINYNKINSRFDRDIELRIINLNI